MKKDVLIKVKSRHILEEDRQDAVELTTTGSFYKKNEAYYIVYEESEMTGMEGTTTTLKVEPEKITLIRMGNINTRQVFIKGKRHTSNYHTLYGNLIMTVIPRKIDADIAPHGGKVNLTYDLEVNGRRISKNFLHISVEEAQK